MSGRECFRAMLCSSRARTNAIKRPRIRPGETLAKVLRETSLKEQREKLRMARPWKETPVVE